MSQLSKSAFVKSLAAAAIGLGVVVSASACSAGQVSQTATQAPAINGATVRDGALVLNDVSITYPSSSDPAAVFAAGGPFQLAFVATTDDLVNDSKLVSITTPRGTVALSGDATVPANGLLRAGTPAGVTPAVGQKTLTATLTNTGDTVAPGLTIPLTFTFTTAGKTTTVVVDTPVDAGSQLERKDKDPADSAEDSHH